MRDLFISERRYIRNLLWSHRGCEVSDFGVVVAEHYCAPRTAAPTRFNNDYVLQFADEVPDSSSCYTTVLPNTFGADLFLTVDNRTSRPLRTELVGGEAFPIRHFKRYVVQISEQLNRLGCPVAIRSSAYCRIFVIGDDICFLVFPSDLAPTMRGTMRLLQSDPEMSIACAVDEGRLVYVDGWMRTDVVRSEWKLLAIPKD